MDVVCSEYKHVLHVRVKIVYTDFVAEPFPKECRRSRLSNIWNNFVRIIPLKVIDRERISSLTFSNVNIGDVIVDVMLAESYKVSGENGHVSAPDILQFRHKRFVIVTIYLIISLRLVIFNYKLRNIQPQRRKLCILLTFQLLKPYKYVSLSQISCYRQNYRYFWCPSDIFQIF